MKLVLIAYYEGIDRDVMDLLDHAGVDSYTQWTRVLGKGSHSGPHLGSHVWPKLNDVLAVATDDETAAELMEGVRRLRQRLGQEGVKAFRIPLDEVT
ncbi:MAG: PG0541 family transporter-associated protein [Candidatus Brocadiia bacterium]